ncbi:MAG: carboxypeptidase-like regulatory domain-containing protein, partial [Candidatus Sumerlaeia bacterium]|nr:carboxypeptidase-like regulatory domain-containing protein [Candidatus Sumerlaeia bacterium]
MLQQKTSRVLRLLLVGIIACWLGCGQQSATPEKETEKGATAGSEEQVEPGIIKGNIRLPGKPSSAGVMVFLSGTSALAFTNENGDFTIENVAPAEYEVFAQKPGYKVASLGKIKVEGGSITLPPFSLEELPALE